MSPPCWLPKEPTISALPKDLLDIVEYAYPDALWIAGERKSGSCYVVYVLDVDQSYNEFVTHLSLDFRWTLSPVRGRCYDAATSPDEIKEPLAWQQRLRKNRNSPTTT